jgi:hypothetical protein
MNGVTAWLQAKPLASRKAVLFAAAAGAVAVSIVLGFLSLPSMPRNFIGGVAGGVLFGVAVLTYQTVFTDAQRARFDLKSRFPLPGRRFKVYVTAALWIIGVLMLGRVTPSFIDPLVGSINVAVLLGLYFLMRRSPIEEIDAVIAGELPLPSEDDKVQSTAVTADADADTK